MRSDIDKYSYLIILFMYAICLAGDSTAHTTNFYYGNGLLAQENEKEGYLTYHFNNVGSTNAVTDEKGAVKYTYAYNPYGELTQGSFGQVMFLFNGQYGVASDDNGLYYMRARYYNVSIKRFINQDVVTGSIAESQSLNRYAYVEGNPVSYLNPFGLEKVDTSKWHGTHMLEYREILKLEFFHLVDK